MSTTIEEQIITAIAARLDDIQTDAWRTTIGASVSVASRKIDPSTMVPGCVIFPGYADNEIESGSTYDWHNLPIAIEALQNLGKADNPSDLAQEMKADIYEAITGPRYTMPFTNGIATATVEGQTITNFTATYTATIEKLEITSGYLTTGDAAGTLYCRRLKTLDSYIIGTATAGSGVGSFLLGAVTGQRPVTVATGGFASEIWYDGGGVRTYPDAGESIVQIRMDFRIRFKTLKGNPYAQA